MMSSMSSMSSLLLRSTTRVISSHQASLSRSALVFSDIQLKDKLKEAKKLEAMPAPASGLITVSGPPDVALTSGMPHQERKERVVRIYKPAKNAMQSGTAGIKR